MFEADLAASDPILLPAWQSRPVDLRLREWFARLWEYWL
jgi:cardiolipin synthase